MVLGENYSKCYARFLGEKGELVEWCTGGGGVGAGATHLARMMNNFGNKYT